ncbi:MAG TPA: hypothetical protein VFU31_20070 [Candidatus Binatia bacterium]|nr:hypothetical protein [Candidatus Binatia bacterium]
MDREWKGTSSAEVSLILRLLEAGNLDTVYRDLYLERAQVLTGALLPHSEYLRLKNSKGEIDDLLRQVAPALERQEWVKVKELTGRIRVMRQTVEEKHALSDVAGKIYEPSDVPFNPFDRGLQGVLALSKQEPAQLRDNLVETLATLEKEDPALRDFYARRRAYFQSLSFNTCEDGNIIKEIDPTQIQRQARWALVNRDISSLERLAEEMLRPKPFVQVKPITTVEPTSIPRVVNGEDPSFIFSEKTLSAARRFQLVSARVESSREFGDYLRCCCAAYAKIPDRPLTEAEKCIEGCTCGHPCPPSISEPLKETLDLLMLHPFINSAGMRYLPRFVPELLLVEDFSEEEKYSSASELLSALGLPRRAALSRMEIDHALLQRGAQIVKSELCLDPQEFRLACIPFDLYSRLAPTQGWGQKKLWTHFDGFQIWKGPKLRALVGGDVRFGGRYDLCSISRADERDGVVARFAVIRRERLITG